MRVNLVRTPVWGCVYCGRSFPYHQGNKDGLDCKCGQQCMAFETKYAFRSWRAFYRKAKAGAV